MDSLSSQLLADLAEQIGEVGTIPFTAFADDNVGHWRVEGMQALPEIQRQVVLFLGLLEEYGLAVNTDKSKVLVRLRGRAKPCLKQYTEKIRNRRCWRFEHRDQVRHVPLTDDLEYLGTVISVRRSSATLTLTHRLAEADKRMSNLRRTIRSRRIIPVATRLALWKTCVLSSALHGLHALRLSSADAGRLGQWYHRQIRAVTHTPAHLTKVSNQDLRKRYDLEHPIALLYRSARTKLERLQSKLGEDITSTDKAIRAWQDTVEHYRRLDAMRNAALVELPTRPEPEHSCPECGLYFSSIKTVRQRMARKHGMKVMELERFEHRQAHHSVAGMPQCRRCKVKLSSLGALQAHIVTNACGWHGPELLTSKDHPPQITDGGSDD